jgi:hypothetical protein
MATPDSLDALDRWLESKGRGHWSKKAREYVAERIHLLGNQHTDEPFTVRLAEYLSAYGTRLIGKSTTASQDKKAHLDHLIASIKKASQASVSPSSLSLYNLLDQALSEQDTVATDTAAPGQIVEDSLLRAAPENGLLELDKASELCVIGDLHGDASTAKRITDWLRVKFSSTGTEMPARAVFLGDYVNNGLKSVKVLEHVLGLKSEYPQHVTLLSGNHEIGETYATALTELLETHWDQWHRLSASLTPGWKTPPGHYGHLRLDLAVHYGADVGEAVHRRFELWGRSLPLCALHEGILMCHSIGLGKLRPSDFSRAALNKAKRDRSDIRKLVNEGYEAWKADKESLHASMVSNRDITARTLESFGAAIGARLFLVGHSHYRSGDRDVTEGPILRRATRHEQGRLATICSSHPRSRDAGHYIAREFEWTRRAKGTDSDNPEPSRECVATACVAVIKDSADCPKDAPAFLKAGDLVPLYQLPYA